MAYTELTGQYILGKTIGTGGFGKVKVATHVATGEKVAIKIMSKNKLQDDMPRVYKEIEALQSLSHPHICELYQVIESSDYVFLVMEYCSGGELFDYIIQKEKLDEDEARGFFRQIVAGVAYCHRLGFAHRDLKPENILLDNDQKLKIVDFGLCVRPTKGSMLQTSCGSPNYAAPELLKGISYYGPQIDIWSLGILLYALLSGNLPFEAEATDQLYGKILSGRYEEPEWFSEESRNLIRALLKIDPKDRLTTDQLCEHPWLNRGFPKSVNALSVGAEEMRRDEDCLRVLSMETDLNPSQLWHQLISSTMYDHNMATYRILLLRKKNRLPLRRLRRQRTAQEKLFLSPEAAPLSKDTYVIKRRQPTEERAVLTTIQDDDVTVESMTSRGTPGRLSRRSASGSRRASKRYRSPGLGDREPLPKKMTMTSRTPSSTPPPATPRQVPKTPSSARRMLNGLERVRKILTPRRSLPRNEAQPVVLNTKLMANVTSTNSSDPGQVLTSLQAALEEKGIICSASGFMICGKVHRPAPGNQQKKMSFELEVCWIPATHSGSAVVGIRRKRLKGDAWLYKEVCQQVLQVAAY